MDATALSLCMDNDMPIYVFNVDDAANIGRVVRGERIGTVVSRRAVLPLAAAVPSPRTSTDRKGTRDDAWTSWSTDAKTRMDKSVEAMRHELNGVRTGRASAALLDRIQVDYYGTRTPLNQLAQISVPEPRLLTITPYDKSTIKEIERAVRVRSRAQPGQRRQCHPAADPAADRGPAQGARQGGPPHRRRRAASPCATCAATRLDHLKDAREAHGEAQADDVHRAEDRVQKLTDEHVKRIDDVLKSKEAEILEV